MMLLCDTPVRVARHEDDALAKALGVHDPNLVRVLGAFGFDPTSAELLQWVPAIELAWLDGMTRAEHERLRRLIQQRHPALSPRAAELLKDWLRRRPSNAFFRTARRAIRAQLRSLPPEERPTVRARVLGPCVDVGEASGGIWGYRTLSTREQAWLEQFAHTLQQADGTPIRHSGGVS